MPCKTDTAGIVQGGLFLKEAVLQQLNREYIGRLLSEAGGNVTRAAAKCGLERQRLQQVMRRYGINADDYRKQPGTKRIPD